MIALSTKTVSIKVDEQLLNDFKIKVAQSGKSLQDYMFYLINNDINPVTEEQQLKAIKEAKLSLKTAMRNLEFSEEKLVGGMNFLLKKADGLLSDYEKILKGCCDFPSLKRKALGMIDYVEEYLQIAIENHNNGIYIIKEKDIPTTTQNDDFYYKIFLEMLYEKRNSDFYI